MESIPKQNIIRLTEIAAKAAGGLGLQILRLTARGTPSRAILEVILDGDRLVRVDDCQLVSKTLGDAIEADESLLKGNFRLDVLSPGLDEPLILDYQFQRTIGHLVEIAFTEESTSPVGRTLSPSEENTDGQSVRPTGLTTTITGTLNSFTAEEITITKRNTKRGAPKNAKGEENTIPRSAITTVYARPDFG